MHIDVNCLMQSVGLIHFSNSVVISLSLCNCYHSLCASGYLYLNCMTSETTSFNIKKAKLYQSRNDRYYWGEFSNYLSNL